MTHAEILKGALQAIKDGIDNGGYYNAVAVGEVDYRKIDYPCVQVVQGRTDETTDLEYSQEVELIIYYEKGVKGYTVTEYLNTLDEIGDTVDEIETEILKSDFIGPYKMNNAEPYAPFEVKNNRLLPFVVTIEYRMHKGG